MIRSLAKSFSRFFTVKPAWLLPAALLLGLTFGLFVYAHWLSGSLPPTSKRLLVYTLLACLFGALGHFFLLKAILLPSVLRLTRAGRGFFLGWSLLGGFLSLLFGSNVWEARTQYLVFLLPEQRLEISVRAAAGAAPSAPPAMRAEPAGQSPDWPDSHVLGWHACRGMDKHRGPGV